MSDRKLSYIIVGFFPTNIEQVFSDIRKKVDMPFEIPILQEDGRCNLIGKPHITVKRTFYLNEGVDEETLVERLSNIQFEQLNLSADKWEVFHTDHLGSVFVININKSPEIVDLHFQLVDAVEDISKAKNPEYEKDGWVPHASVVYWAEKDKIPELEKLVSGALPINYILPEVHLFRKDLSTKEDPKGPDFRELVKVITSKS